MTWANRSRWRLAPIAAVGLALDTVVTAAVEYRQREQGWSGGRPRPAVKRSLMRHKSYTTTQKYINMARQMDAAVASLHVPEVLRQGVGG